MHDFSKFGYNDLNFLYYPFSSTCLAFLFDFFSKSNSSSSENANHYIQQWTCFHCAVTLVTLAETIPISGYQYLNSRHNSQNITNGEKVASHNKKKYMYIKGPLKETNLTFNALAAHEGYSNQTSWKPTQAKNVVISFIQVTQSNSLKLIYVNINANFLRRTMEWFHFTCYDSQK